MPSKKSLSAAFSKPRGVRQWVGGKSEGREGRAIEGLIMIGK